MSSPATQSPFDAIALREGGREVWSARDLMPKLGYRKWERFFDAIERAKVACSNSGHRPADHFPGAGKMVKIGSETERQVEDFHLTRYAAYLVAMNGDPRKPEIAAAQTYFAIKTREAETASVQRTHAVVQVQQPDRTRVEIPGITRPKPEVEVQPASVGEVDSSDPLIAGLIAQQRLVSGLIQVRQDQIHQGRRLTEMEERVHAIEGAAQQARESLSALPVSTESAPDLTMSAKCNQAVRAISSLTHETFDQIWKRAYGEYDLRFSVILKVRVENYNKDKRAKDKLSKLAYVEKFGNIQALYDILFKLKEQAATSQRAIQR
jgi:hypothetical protein